MVVVHNQQGVSSPGYGHVHKRMPLSKHGWLPPLSLSVSRAVLIAAHGTGDSSTYDSNRIGRLLGSDTGGGGCPPQIRLSGMGSRRPLPSAIFFFQRGWARVGVEREEGGGRGRWDLIGILVPGSVGR